MRLPLLLPLVVASLLLVFPSTGQKATTAAKPPSNGAPAAAQGGRERIRISEGWKFFRYDEPEKANSLIYDVRPEVRNEQDSKAADHVSLTTAGQGLALIAVQLTDPAGPCSMPTTSSNSASKAPAKSWPRTPTTRPI